MAAIQWVPLRGNTLAEIGLAKQRQEGGGPVPTPFPTWNATCGEEGGRVGLGRSWLVLVGGLPGEGKTGLVLNLVVHAVKQGHNVGMVNLEMSLEGMATRFLSIHTGIPREVLDRGPDFSAKAWANAVQHVEKSIEQGAGIVYTHDDDAVTLADLEKAYADLAAQDVSMVVVDYAQLIDVPGSDLYEKSRKVAMKIKGLSKRYRVVTVAASQLTRRRGTARPGDDAPKDRSPQLEDIAEGSPWERTASQVLLIDHTKTRYIPATRTRVMTLVCPKNRHGERDWKLEIAWDLDTMIMTEQ